MLQQRCLQCSIEHHCAPSCVWQHASRWANFCADMRVTGALGTARGHASQEGFAVPACPCPQVWQSNGAASRPHKDRTPPGSPMVVFCAASCGWQLPGVPGPSGCPGWLPGLAVKAVWQGQEPCVPADCACTSASPAGVSLISEAMVSGPLVLILRRRQMESLPSGL